MQQRQRALPVMQPGSTRNIQQLESGSRPYKNTYRWISLFLSLRITLTLSISLFLSHPICVLMNIYIFMFCSISASVSVCVSISLSVSLSLSLLCVWVSVCLCLCLSLSVALCVSPCLPVSLYLSLSRSLYLSVSVSLLLSPLRAFSNDDIDDVACSLPLFPIALPVPYWCAACMFICEWVLVILNQYLCIGRYGTRNAKYKQYIDNYWTSLWTPLGSR